MLNSEKYKSAEERARAFKEWCHKQDVECNKCRLFSRSEMSRCRFAWLDLEAEEEKIEDCPYCGGVCRIVKNKYDAFVVGCDSCCYTSQDFDRKQDAIAAHNRVARASMEAWE